MEQSFRTSDVIYIAAADSAEQDRMLADYVCTGANDQDVIQAAVDLIYQPVCGEIRGRRIILLPGHYFVTAFPRRNENGRVAVMMRAGTNSFAHIAILIAGSEHTESTVIHVTKEAYDSVADGESCSVFGCEAANWNHHVFKDLYVTVHDDRKNIICFDGRFMGSMGLRRCKCLCDTRGNYSQVKDPLPVEGFVAFMGTYGSNNMWEEKWEFCQAEGFGQGFAVGNEHLLLHKCAALFGRYGFTFNNYPSMNTIAHPMTLLNCIDEANANFWKFAKNTFKQCINAYNTSFELMPHWFALSGNYAKEEHPGDYYGSIDYVINHGYATENDPTIALWERGSGIHFRSVNHIQKTICSTEERLGYAPNPGQEVFDSDLNKKLIYTGCGWVDMLGNPAE